MNVIAVNMNRKYTLTRNVEPIDGIVELLVHIHVHVLASHHRYTGTGNSINQK